MPVASSSYPVVEPGFSSPMQFSGSLEHEGGGSNMLADANKVVQVLTFYSLFWLPLLDKLNVCSCFSIRPLAFCCVFPPPSYLIVDVLFVLNLLVDCGYILCTWFNLSFINKAFYL